MTAVAAALWNQNQAAMGSHAAVKATPMADQTGGTGSTSGSDGNAAMVSANDFLTLLVTEMKNQDPTAATDPNEYINQLVNVNSLQQLISINQTLTTSLAPSTDSSGATGYVAPGKGSAKATPNVAQAAAQTTRGVATKAQTPGNEHVGVHGTAPTKVSQGNLTIPQNIPGADRVASSLGGRSHSQRVISTQ
jgi:flagellar basal-body rod modification protein FlgD